MIFTRSRFLISILISFLFISTSYASCGLQSCPCSVNPLESKAGAWTFVPRLQYASFDIDHHNGHYSQFSTHAHYDGFSRWILGGLVSYVGLDDGRESHSGLGNPMIFAEYKVGSYWGGQLSVGSQWELPWGDDEHGMAAHHSELVPYVSLQKMQGGLNWHGSLGYRTNIGHDNGHHHELLVNPHEDKELLYRLEALFCCRARSWVPKIFIDGQHVIEGDENEGKGFLTGGGSLSLSMGKGTSISLEGELPLTSPKRFDWKAGLIASLRI